MLSGARGWLAQDEMDILNESNEDYKSIDPIDERITSKLQWDIDQSYWRDASATQIALDIGLREPKPSDSNKVASCLKARGIEQRRTSKGRHYRVPPAFGATLSLSNALTDQLEDLAF